MLLTYSSGLKRAAMSSCAHLLQVSHFSVPPARLPLQAVQLLPGRAAGVHTRDKVRVCRRQLVCSRTSICHVRGLPHASTLGSGGISGMFATASYHAYQLSSVTP